MKYIILFNMIFFVFMCSCKYQENSNLKENNSDNHIVKGKNSPNGKIIYDGGLRGFGAGGKIWYKFCPKKIEYCYKPNATDLFHCKYGTWSMKDNIVQIHFIQEKGRRGVGKPLDIATADVSYSKHENYDKTINERKEINWDDVLKNIDKLPNEKGYRRWIKIEENSDCDW